MEDSIWKNPFLLEMKMQQIISTQSRSGVQFRRRKAQFGIHILKERIINIDKELIPLLPPMLNKGTELKKPFLKSGKLSKFAQAYADEHGLDDEIISGPFTRLWYTPFDPGKTQALKFVMMQHGWKPAQWNLKKNPLREMEHLPPAVRIEAQKAAVQKYILSNILAHGDEYKELVLKELGYGRRTRTMQNLFDFVKKKQFWPTSPQITPDEDKFEGDAFQLKLIQQRMVWAHRKGLLEGLVALTREDGKISAEAIPCATPTARMRHRGVVNIPAARSPMGAFIRGLFVGNNNTTVPHTTYTNELKEGERLVPLTNRVQEWNAKKDRWEDSHPYKIHIPQGCEVFVGFDGSGLELRMLAHYVGDPEFTKQILDGDIHTYNQQLAGLPTRDAAKTFIYAFVYGGGDAKLGELVGGGAAEGAQVRARFLAELPMLKKLIENTQAIASKHGFVYGIDGRKLWLRQDASGKYQTHKSLNVLLQGAGAIVMKYATTMLEANIKKLGLRATKVLDVHDEGQYSCHPDDVKQLRYLMETCVERAGQVLKMNCPLASDSAAGRSWLDTH